MRFKGFIARYEIDSFVVEVFHGDITCLDVDAIVNPANSYLLMGGGLAGVLKRKGGKKIEEEAIKKAPVPVGQAVLTGAGNLKARFIIHAPTMEKPAEKIPVRNVELAVKAALNLANKYGLKSLAIPGLGSGVGGVEKAESARVICDNVVKLKGGLRRIVLADRSLDQVEQFNRQMKRVLSK